MGGRRRLNDVLTAGCAGVAGTARNDDAELGGDDVETFGDVLSNLHPGAGATSAGFGLWFYNYFDALQMRGQRTATARRTRLLWLKSFKLSLNIAESGLHLFKGKGVLAFVKLLRAFAIGRALDGFEE
jgi:hypothetical protein